jgi:hypothetical protein
MSRAFRVNGLHVKKFGKILVRELTQQSLRSKFEDMKLLEQFAAAAHRGIWRETRAKPIGVCRGEFRSGAARERRSAMLPELRLGWGGCEINLLLGSFRPAVLYFCTVYAIIGLRPGHQPQRRPTLPVFLAKTEAGKRLPPVPHGMWI